MDGLRRESIHTAVDTCGGVRWDLLHPVVERADLILYDLKIFDEASHLHHTGIPLQRVLENARRTAALEKPMWIRTPVIPGISDGAENIARIADFIIAHLPTVERYDLLAFNKNCIPKYQRLGRDFVLEREHLVSTEKMQSLISIARERGVENTHWSGFSS
jgi:pyruvate formate lyase activating enzyme